jgi:glycosyltransferase involved in cell wall biosynthesis
VPAVLNRVLVSTDTVGGVWQYALELAGGFAARGTQIVLAVMGPPATEAQRAAAGAIPGLQLIETGLPLDWLADGPARLEEAARRLTEIAERLDVDTIHLHAPALVPWTDWPAPVVAVAHSCVGTWWRDVHGGPMPDDLAWRAEATARGLGQADQVIAPSEAFAAALRTCYGRDYRIRVIRNGRRPVLARAVRRPRVLTAGRLWDEGKNIAILDAAAALLAHVVCAAGPVAGPNGAAAACSNLRLLGCLGEAALATEYRAAAVFVSVARYEPFGLAVLEAAQAGCALVLSDIPTFRELWADAALFVDPGDAPRLAATLRDLLREPARWMAWGERARERALAFSAARMVAETYAEHDAMLGARLTRTAA